MYGEIAMKLSEIKEDLAIQTKSSALRRENRVKGARKGIIKDAETRKRGTVCEVLVQFEGESEARYVAIARIEVLIKK
jgi:hypothetical protein